MRITAEEKIATRKRILDSARRLFREEGFADTTTRDISRAAGVAAGTLFNYFPTKEDVVLELAAEAIAKAVDDFHRRRRDGATLEEDLFGFIAAQLRKLRPLRTFLGPALETSMHPARSAQRDGQSDAIRTAYFESLGDVLAEHGLSGDLPTTAAHLHWSLYLGVMAFWTADRSPKQEDTLALLDESIQMFVQWLRSQNPPDQSR